MQIEINNIRPQEVENCNQMILEINKALYHTQLTNDNFFEIKSANKIIYIQ